jgi:hypothetical protein
VGQSIAENFEGQNVNNNKTEQLHTALLTIQNVKSQNVDAYKNVTLAKIMYFLLHKLNGSVFPNEAPSVLAGHIC